MYEYSYNNHIIARIMNKYIKYSYFDDIKRIKGGYMPKAHFIFLYDIFKVLFVSKLSAYDLCNNFIVDILNYRKLINSIIGRSRFKIQLNDL